MRSKQDKQYKRIIRRYYKKIVKMARYAGKNPFDAELGIQILAEYIKYMRDYYKLGVNVHSEEIEGHDRYQTLAAAYEEYEYGWDIGCKLSKKYYEQVLVDEDTALVDTKRPLFGLSQKEAHEKWDKEKHTHRDNFFRIVAEEYGNWWDQTVQPVWALC